MPQFLSAFSFSAFQLFALLFLLPGCLAPPPQSPVLRIDPWDANHPESRCIVTPHYRIYTDLKDSDDLEDVGRVMEAAFAQYQQTFRADSNASPLRGYLFSRRDEWAEFTARNTGSDAAIYLKINRGAYTIDDWFVAFWLGDRGTHSVIAHEGWHQYVARHFRGRLIPTLEEGFACQFENIELVAGRAVFHQGYTPARSHALADAIAERRLWALRDLLKIHAGDIVHLTRPQIETFYAQNWAMSRFLMERYPEQMKDYLADVAAGTEWRPSSFRSLKPNEWNPNLSGPQLQHYLQTPLTSLEQPFLRYCHKLSREAP